MGHVWMGQAEDSIQQRGQLTGLKQTKEWERYPKWLRRLYETHLTENLGKHCREWPAAKTESGIKFLIKQQQQQQQHQQQQTSKSQDLIEYTDGSSPKTSQGGASLSSKVRPPSMKTVQPIRYHPPAWQWRWKQSSMFSAGLPLQVTLRPHMPSSSQIQWAYYRMWKVEWEAQPGMRSTLRTSCRCTALDMPESKDVLPWTCRNQRKWPRR